MEMHKSKYYDKVQKLKTIGIMKQNNLAEQEAADFLFKVLNQTVYKKKPIDQDINIIDATLHAIHKKHELYIGYIMPVKVSESENFHYSFSLRLRNEHLDTIYARTILEGMCKSLLVIYYHIKLKEDNSNGGV